MKTTSFRNPLFSIKDKPAKTKGLVRRPDANGKAEKPIEREQRTRVSSAAPEQEGEQAQELFKLELPSANKEALEKEASGMVVSELDLGSPLPVFLTEAARVGAATLRYWQPRKPHNVGMAAAQKQIGEAVAAEIAHLLERFAVVESQWKKASAQQKDETLVRARFVYRETRLAIEFVLDDGVEDGNDAVFAALTKTHGVEPSIPELASALTAFSLFGNDVRDRLVDVDGFDVALLDEARSLAQTLRLRGEATVKDDVASSLRHDCDVLLSMIQKRVAKVRRAARYVFRNEPQLVREFTSSYARERRRKVRKGDVTVSPTAPTSPSKEGPTD